MMADPSERGLDEKINTWVQTSGIIMAAVWALYTFIYKEFTVPQSAPVNVSINLKLQKTGVYIPDKKNEKGLAAIEILVSAKNPSSITTHLLPSVFIVYGYKIFDPAASLKDDIIVLNKESKYKMKHCALSEPTIIASGKLIDDKELKENDQLKPGELVTRTFVFYVPVGEYDVIEAHTMIPNAKDISKIELEWYPDKERGLVATAFSKSEDGTLEPMRRDESGGYAEGPGKWQTAHSMSMMSLW
jgi:hypothetical protein